MKEYIDVFLVSIPSFSGLQSNLPEFLIAHGVTVSIPSFSGLQSNKPGLVERLLEAGLNPFFFRSAV